MGNPHKGEFGFEAGGERYTLRFGANVIATMEEDLSLSLVEIGGRMETEMKIGFLRTVFGYGLSRHHPGLTPEQVGDIMDDVGLDKVGGLIGDAFRGSLPDAGEGGDGEDPPPTAAKTARARRGTGKPS